MNSEPPCSEIMVAPLRGEDRIKGQVYIFRNKKRIWGGLRWNCEHGRQLNQCGRCGGSSVCEHGKRRNACKECNGSSICMHGKQRNQCRKCGGSAFCEHGKRRNQCRNCNGSSFCDHGRRRNRCNSCDQQKNPQNWCISCLSVYVMKSNYYPYCRTCYHRLSSNADVPKCARIKEHYLKDEIISIPELKNFILTFDKQVDSGCSGRRPDIRVELLTHSIILECDENQHSSAQCEEKRMMELFQDLGNRPLIMIRFNPDAYSKDDEKFQGCFNSSENGLVLNKNEWEKRIAQLIPIIKKHVLEVPSKEITVEYLFYSNR